MLQDRKLQNAIMRKLIIHTAVSEGKLFNMVAENDQAENMVLFNHAIRNLQVKNLIDVVSDTTGTMLIVRLRRDVLH